MIYLDHAATTPLPEAVADTMYDVLRHQFGNPSAQYPLGREAKELVEEARRTIAGALGCQPSALHFTSCGTESDNWAIRAAAWQGRHTGRHIITTAVEHSAVLEPCRQLEQEGYEVTYLKPDRTGHISAGQVAEALREEREAKAEVGVVLDETTFHDGLSAPQVGSILARLYPGWDGALYQHYLEKFGLTSKKLVKTFSKGMKMKLSLAAAFAARPRLLILDEATSGLDPVVRDEILDEFLAFIQDEEHAILLSSHITSDLEKVADYVTYLHRGRVAVSGAKDELLDTYGKLTCARSDLERVDRSLLAGVRTNQFGCEALVKNRRAFARFHPELAVEPVSLEDIMVFTVKGDAR